jgi:hypothetical protein
MDEEEEIRTYCLNKVANSVLVVLRLLHCEQLSDLYDDEVKDHATFRRHLKAAKVALHLSLSF